MSVRGLIIVLVASICLSLAPAVAESYVILVDDRSSNVWLATPDPITAAPNDLTLPEELTLRYAIASGSPFSRSLIAEGDEYDLERAQLNDLLSVSVRQDSSIDEWFITLRIYTIEESFDLDADDLKVSNARLIVPSERYNWTELYDSSRSSAVMTRDVQPVDEYVEVEKEPDFDYKRIASLVHYPDLARRAEIEGQVTVAALIDENGHVERAMILESVSPILQPYALRAVLLTEFTNAVKNGKPIKTWVRIPLKFILR